MQHDTVAIRTERLRFIARYLGLLAVGNLLWEFAQMPFYTVWQSGTVSEITYNGLHCTAGDVLIAATALLTAVLLVGAKSWPSEGYWKVAAAAVSIGLAYTVFSESLNVYVRQSWAYSQAMPIIPFTGIGLLPVIQWCALPTLAFIALRSRVPSISR
ncbi:MAG: hypothetical protein KJ622_07370 [Alphaproteobacteria bacterium]|nr:hypothetical protein [Alphaproteobacteria bacterium]